MLERQPLGLSEALLALDYRLDVPRELAVVQPAPAEDDPLVEIVRSRFVPNKALAVAGPDDALATLVPWLQGKEAIGGQTTAYVCEHGRCELPTAEPETLRQQLARALPYPD